MPARKHRPAKPVMADLLPPDSASAALSLLAFFGDPKNQARAKTMLAALQDATKANQEALAGFGPANRIADLEAEAESGRTAAAEELAAAKVEAVRIITIANADAEARIKILDSRESAIGEREHLVKSGERGLEQKRTEFEHETAGLRKVLG